MLKPFTIITTDPTPAAIARAERNAMGSTRVVKPLPMSNPADVTMWFLVNSRNGKDYWTVDTINGTCNCPAFARDGICKHCVMVRDHIAADNRLEEMANAALEVDAGED